MINAILFGVKVGFALAAGRQGNSVDSSDAEARQSSETADRNLHGRGRYGNRSLRRKREYIARGGRIGQKRIRIRNRPEFLSEGEKRNAERLYRITEVHT